MNIKKNLWENNPTSRGEDASIFANINPNNSLYPEDALGTNFYKNLELINKRIYHIHKQLTYWDLYKITTSVSSPTDFESTVAALTPGEACIINTTTFSSGQNTFHRGDVLVKTVDNEIVYVETINSGMYYPKKISYDNNTYSISYFFSPAAPQDDVSSASLNEEAAFAKEITFTGLQSVEAGYIYGIFREIDNTEQTFEAIYTRDNDLICPVIKFFVKVDDQYEEINGTFSIIFDGSVTPKLWRVTPNFYNDILGEVFMQVK